MAPVGIVTVVSMKTIWNRNRVKTPTSYELPLRKKPFVPKSPIVLPKSVMVNSCVNGAVPPSGANAPTPPICKANPHSQYPNMPMG